MLRDRHIGIDLGTVNVYIFVRGKGIVLREPSVVAINKETGKILAIGEEARRMVGKTPGNIVTKRPMRDGVIADYNTTEKMLEYFIRKVWGRRRFAKPKVIVGIPSGGTEVEKRAVIEASLQAGAKEAFLVEEPMAAALGAGIDVGEPNGNMVVDIGGGTTDIAIISLGGIVVNNSIRIAGNKFDEDIMRYIRSKYNLIIGENTAERIKIEIGTAIPPESEEENLSTEVRGRDLVSGLPKGITITSREVNEALRDSLREIIDGVKRVLESSPPELSSDIADRGIVLTGGGALLRKIDRLLAEATETPITIAENPLSCVAIGTGKVLDYIKVLRQGRGLITVGK